MLSILLLVLSALPAYAQSGFNDDRVMLQGFYWESYRHGHPEYPVFGSEHWYEIVRDQAEAIREGRFDLIWLPPPSYAGPCSAGYNPNEYFHLYNSYGSFDEHRAMLEALLSKGVEPIADIVINHRDGSRGWAGFRSPDWGTWAITKNDEAFTAEGSEVKDTPVSDRGNEEEKPSEYTTHSGTTYAYPGFRDIDHTNLQVRQDIVRYLKQLQSMGYRGWRYDMVHGFHARWIAYYNKRTQPTFSVGEYDWDKHAEQRGWVWHTATAPNPSNANQHLMTSSSVFDFSTQFLLKDHKKDYAAWYGFGHGPGLVGDTTDNLPWKNRAVTFLENHDTGYRTDPDGSPQKGKESDSFEKGWQVEQAYAAILTLPGVPTVYWKHYFDWGQDLQDKIRALINARKVAGVHAGSQLDLQVNAKTKGVYAARVGGQHGDLYVRIGGSDQDWQPSLSGYQDYREYAQGDGWKVWVSLPGNPPVQQAPLKPAFPIPTYQPPEQIIVTD